MDNLGLSALQLDKKLDGYSVHNYTITYDQFDETESADKRVRT